MKPIFIILILCFSSTLGLFHIDASERPQNTIVDDDGTMRITTFTGGEIRLIRPRDHPENIGDVDIRTQYPPSTPSGEILSPENGSYVNGTVDIIFKILDMQYGIIGERWRKSREFLGRIVRKLVRKSKR